MKTQKIKEIFEKVWSPKAAEYTNDPSKMARLAQKALEFVDNDALKKVKDKIVLLADYIRDVATGRYKDYQWQNLAIAVAAMVYLVSPVDAIPDFIAIIGWTDDVTVILYACKRMDKELERYRCSKMATAQSLTSSPSDGVE